MEFNRIGEKADYLNKCELTYHDGKPVKMLRHPGLEHSKIKISNETIRLWIRDKQAAKLTSVEAFCGILNAVVSIELNLTVTILSDETSFEEFIKHLPFDKQDSRFSSWPEEGGAFKEYYFTDEEDADSTYDQMRGLHYIFREEVEQGTVKEVRMGLAVHAPAKAFSARSNKSVFVPATLYIPRVTGLKPYSYTGMLTDQYGVMTVYLRQNEARNRDICVIMLGMPIDADGQLERTGVMATASQLNMSMPVSFNVRTRRVDREFDQLAYEEFRSQAPTRHDARLQGPSSVIATPLLGNGLE